MNDTPKRQAPAFQFYADDFLGGTTDMTNEEVGAYIRLLCAQWTKGGIPNDPQRASMMAGAMPVPSLGYVLAKFQLCEDGMLRNARLEEVRAASDRYREKQAEKGVKGAKKRWSDSRGHGRGHSTGMAAGMAEGMAGAWPKVWPEDGSPSPTPSPNVITHIDGSPEVELPPGFPKTAQEAIERAGMAGVGREVAENAWLMASSRGGMDSKGQPILNWASHVAICAKWAASRDAEGKARTARQGVSSTKGGQDSVWQIKTRLEAAEAEMKAIKNRGHEDAWGWKPKTSEDGAELRRLKKVASELRKQLAG